LPVFLVFVDCFIVYCFCCWNDWSRFHFGCWYLKTNVWLDFIICLFDRYIYCIWFIFWNKSESPGTDYWGLTLLIIVRGLYEWLRVYTMREIDESMFGIIVIITLTINTLNILRRSMDEKVQFKKLILII
jgi:hypothetical protein